MKLKTYQVIIYSYPQMAPLRLGIVPIFMIFLYICQINLYLDETLNLISWVAN